MKKIYISLLLLLIIPAIRCMEKPITPTTESSKLSLRALLQDKICKEYIEKVYFDAFKFASHTDNFSFRHDGNKTLITLITDMETLKTKGITEDHLGIYAYNQCDWKNDSHRKQCVPLLFSCIKNYKRNAIEIKGTEESKVIIEEALPKMSYYDNNLLTLPNDSLFNKLHPTYYKLTQNLKSLFDRSNFKEILIFLYSKKRMSFHHHYPEAIEIDLKNKFYPEVIFLLDKAITVFDDNLEKLYNLLQTIDKAKNIYTDEKKLGLAIWNLDLNCAERLIPEDIPFQKSRIMRFCSLVQHYNENKGTKKTPTPTHYSHYFLIKDIDLALPDSFDATLVDKSKVAFEEFKELISDIIKIKHQTKEVIQQKIHDIYFKENKENDEKNISVTNNIQ